MYRLICLLLLIGVIASQGGLGAAGYFSDSGQNSGNTFTAWVATTVNLHPDSGVDETGSLYSLTPGDLDNLAHSDNSRYTTQDTWEDAYSDDEYLGFGFPDIPSGVSVLQVSITVEWQRKKDTYDARLRVFDGQGHEQVYALTLPPKNEDGSETIDVSAFIDTVQKVNGLEVWFQAVSSKGETTKHDLIEVEVAYE